MKCNMILDTFLLRINHRMPEFLLEATSLDLAGNQKKFLEILL